MHDRDLRRALLADLRNTFASDPATLIVEEMGLCQGERRVDVAVINGELHGYELKSDADDLARLPGQVAVYGAVLDRMTLVSSPVHVSAASRLVPEWWGIVVAEPAPEGDLALDVAREGSSNDGLDPRALVQLLWREEAVELLRSCSTGPCAELARRPRRFVWAVLADNVPIDDLRFGVRAALKRRQGWRAGA